MDIVDIYYVGHIRNVFDQLLHTEALRGQVEEDGDCVAYQPYAAPYDNAPDKDTCDWVRIGPARKINNHARDDYPYGRKGVTKDVEPDAFQVKIFMAVTDIKAMTRFPTRPRTAIPSITGMSILGGDISLS